MKAGYSIMAVLLMSVAPGFSQNGKPVSATVVPNPYPGKHVLTDTVQKPNKPCPYSKTKSDICPVCQKNDKVVPIVYGLVVEYADKNPDKMNINGLIISSKSLIPKKKKYKLGGCIVSVCQPRWFCERDEKRF